MKNLPKARTENLVEQNLGKETLIYDLMIHKAFNLNETLSIVYKACDGSTTFDELKRQSKFTDDFIYLALDELKRENLLAQNYQSPFADTSRREMIKKVGLATMFALPLIAGLVAPTAANAASNAADSTGSYGGACYPVGQGCNPDPEIGFPYTCANGTCCKYGTGGNLPSGASYSFASICGNPNSTVSCNDIMIFLDPKTSPCCSGKASGFCTFGDYPMDSEGNIIPCDNGDGTLSFGGEGSCDCTCL